MTTEQKEAFQKYGCGCRCLLFFANQRGNPITISEFVQQYASLYPIWEKENQWGITNTGSILDLARKLQIASSMTTYRGHDTVKNLMNQGVTQVILVTEKIPDQNGCYSDFFHCRIVLPQKTSATEFQVFDPVEIDKGAGALEILPNAEIDRQLGHFLLLQ